jgi:alpha-glucosidase
MLGEFLPPGAITFSGVATSADHNRYAEEWSRLQKEVLDVAGQEDKIIFHRSGFTSSPGMTSLFWTGDQLVSWDAYDGIKAGLVGLLTSGLTGFSLNHTDVGGYSTFSLPVMGVEFGHKRSKELLLRWMELGAFGCVFRTHEGSMPQENSQFYSDEDLLNHLSFCGKLFQSLKNYKKQLMVEASNYGFPLIRTMFFEFPSDPGNFIL